MNFLFSRLHGILFAMLFVVGVVNAQETTPEAMPIVSPCSAPEANIVATIGMISDVARTIGGDCVQVTGLMGAGVDPHLYTATERDVETLFNADLIFYAGLNLEARMVDVFEQIRDGMGKPTIAVSETIDVQMILEEPSYEAPDPHVWMDVSLWRVVAGAIRDQLAALLPQHEAYFNATYDAYMAELEALDEYAREQIASIPDEQRLLITAHDAFQYFSRAYGIEVYAPQGISTESEVGVQNIRATIQLLVERQIPAVFIESSISPDTIEAIIAGAEDQGHTVSIGGLLYSDALGDDDTPEGTYIGMIRHNVDTIVAGLTGQGE